MATDYLRNMRFYHADVVDRVVAFKVLDPYNTLVRLDDDSLYIYDENTMLLRQLPNPREMTDDEYRYEFGKTLERILFYKRISQLELSQMTGISQPTISGYIRGRISPTFRNLDRIARALDCSMEEFRYAEI